MIRVKTEEGHYTIKRVTRLPKKGNANWLYAIIGNSIDEFYRWDAFKSAFEVITLGGSGTTNIQAGTNITIIGTGTSSDPYIVNSTGGADGQDGENGLSAYELAVNGGFVGTEAEWLTSLQGVDGVDGVGGLTEGGDKISVTGAGSVGDPFIVSVTDKIIETSIPVDGIEVDGTKVYHIESGVIKPAIPSGNHVEGEDTEIISNPTDGASLAIDLRDYPNIALQGGGFTESPANYFTLFTDEEDELLKQHWTLMSWRRGNLFISNSMNYIPVDAITYSTVNNILNTYVQVVFNKIINKDDLVLGNFSKTFNQNGDTATDITLDSVTDSNGDPISINTFEIRVYFSFVGTTNGLSNFTLTAASLDDLYGNNVINLETTTINAQGGDPISALSNVIAYWKEGDGDNTSGTATKTDIVGSKVFSASGEGNPSLVSGEWQFDGVDDGFRLVDSEINALINADAKDMQIHYVGSFDETGARIVCATKVGFSPNSLWNLIFNAFGDSDFVIFDDAGSTVDQEVLATATLSQDYYFGMRFYQDSGNKVDLYMHDGTTETSVLAVDISTINVSAVTELFIGMRETTTSAYYDVNFKSLVIADSSADFNTIKTELIP